MGGRPGYFKPDANRSYITFRLSQAQEDAIAPHRFEKEKTEAFLNRLWHQLSIALDDEAYTPPFVPLDHEPRLKTQAMRLSPISLQLLERQWQGTKQSTIDRLVDWSAQLPVTQEIKSSSEVLSMLTILIESSDQQRIEASKALDLLVQQCSIACARQWITELIKSKHIRAIDNQTEEVARVAINRKRFSFLTLN